MYGIADIGRNSSLRKQRLPKKSHQIHDSDMWEMLKKKNHYESDIPEVGPDLFVLPHVLPALMELFAGKRQKGLSQQEQMLAHLATCHYCRTAVMVLLGQELEYDRRSKTPEEPTRNLLTLFANISHEIEAREARESELMGKYAEIFVVEGRERAAQRFPDVAAHLSICPDCYSVLEATVASITQEEETD